MLCWIDHGLQNNTICLICFHSITLPQEMFGFISNRAAQRRETSSVSLSLWAQQALLATKQPGNAAFIRFSSLQRPNISALFLPLLCDMDTDRFVNIHTAVWCQTRKKLIYNENYGTCQTTCFIIKCFRYIYLSSDSSKCLHLCSFYLFSDLILVLWKKKIPGSKPLESVKLKDLTSDWAHSKVQCSLDGFTSCTENRHAKSGWQPLQHLSNRYLSNHKVAVKSTYGKPSTLRNMDRSKKQ